jgi:hypothetical protein
MKHKFEETELWRHTLASTSAYSAENKNIDKLRTAYLNARNNTREIASLIIKEQSDLTLHDITHIEVNGEKRHTERLSILKE